MRKLAIILTIILGLLALVPSTAQTQEMGKYKFFSNFDPATSYWCYEADCATTKNTPKVYTTSGQLYVGYYALKTLIIDVRTLASTSLTVRVEGRVDQLETNNPVWSNIWTKTYSAATTGLSGSDPIAEAVIISEHWDYLRVGTLVTSNQTGDVLYVHGNFKMRN